MPLLAPLAGPSAGLGGFVAMALAKPRWPTASATSSLGRRNSPTRDVYWDFSDQQTRAEPGAADALPRRSASRVLSIPAYRLCLPL